MISFLLTVTGPLAQLVERRTREHNVSGLYRCGFESPAGQLKLLIVSSVQLRILGQPFSPIFTPFFLNFPNFSNSGPLF